MECLDEFRFRTKLYSQTYAKLVIHKPDGLRIDLFAELEKLRPQYNKKYHGVKTLAHHEQREREVCEREKKLCAMILDKYVNGKDYCM